MWWLLLFAAPLSAQELDLKAIQDLRDELPSVSPREPYETPEVTTRRYRFEPPVKVISMDAILASPKKIGVLKEKSQIVYLSDEQKAITQAAINIRYFSLPDEHGFAYLVDQFDFVYAKVLEDRIESLMPILEMREAPTVYTPRPLDLVEPENDGDVNLRPELAYYLGIVNGSYMKDLFNDSKAQSGTTNQFGAHLMTDWKLPVRAGITVHYEKSIYQLSSNGSVDYSALSFGPIIKTRDFEPGGFILRGQLQYRISPYAKATAPNQNGTTEFRFNSSDLLISLEHPVKNQWGEFNWGVFHQSQWLSLKDQNRILDIRATNETNKSFGISVSQVFQ